MSAQVHGDYPGDGRGVIDALVQGDTPVSSSSSHHWHPGPYRSAESPQVAGGPWLPLNWAGCLHDQDCPNPLCDNHLVEGTVPDWFSLTNTPLHACYAPPSNAPGPGTSLPGLLEPAVVEEMVGDAARFTLKLRPPLHAVTDRIAGPEHIVFHACVRHRQPAHRSAIDDIVGYDDVPGDDLDAEPLPSRSRDTVSPDDEFCGAIAEDAATAGTIDAVVTHLVSVAPEGETDPTAKLGIEADLFQRAMRDPTVGHAWASGGVFGRRPGAAKEHAVHPEET